MRFKFMLALSILFLALAVIGQEETPVPIGAGTFSGEITESNLSDLYSIELLAGQQLTVAMLAVEGSELDAELFLFDSAGTLRASDDDSAGERDARIIFSVTEAGQYLIQAGRYETTGTVGAYQLVVTLSILNDPLSIPPSFAVPFSQISYEAVQTGELSPQNTQIYYVIGARQGEFVQIELNTTGDLLADVQLFNQRLEVRVNLAESSPNQQIIYATILETGWYLIALNQQSGSGDFTMLPSLISNTTLEDDTLVEARFDANSQTHFFVFNAAINERIFVNMSITEGQNIISSLIIEDLNRNPLDESVSAGQQSRVSITVPRSGPYIVQVRNTGTGQTGAFSLQLRRSPVDTDKLDIDDVQYNQNYRNFISNGNPIRYYRFSGKANELVTVRMIADAGNQLDPYLILADAAFNELIFNDNVTASRNAQISQFRLPADGDYYILASRADLAAGGSLGSFTLEITAGEIQLEAGRLTAELRWNLVVDLNLFVRSPQGYTISWANPEVAGGGILQIDSNTGCETLTAQPIEYVYWPVGSTLEPGDYTIWVWYQRTCSSLLPVSFTLTLALDGVNILPRPGLPQQNFVLLPNQRLEVVIRVAENGTVGIVNEGTVSSPSPQQSASQGGDILIADGEIRTGAINDSVFAQFYQFEGTAGNRVRIRVERITGNLDPIVFLRDSLDRPLPDGENDDISPTDNNSELIYTLPEDGIYVIAVSRYGLRDGTTLGDYRLSLEFLED